MQPSSSPEVDTTTAPADSTSASQKEPAATPSAAAAPDVKQPASPPKTAPPPAQKTHHELRLEPRIRVRWHADALVDGQGAYHGFVKDISIGGTDIFLDVNLQKIKSIKMRIHVPPLNKKSSPHVMEVACKVVFSAYDSNEFLFHTGIKFVRFNSEADQAILQSRIAMLTHAR